MGLGKRNSDATFSSCLPMSPSAPRSNAMKPKGILICLHESPIPSKRNKLATGYDLGSQRAAFMLTIGSPQYSLALYRPARASS